MAYSLECVDSPERMNSLEPVDSPERMNSLERMTALSA